MPHLDTKPRLAQISRQDDFERHPACLFAWWLGLDLNQRPPGYPPKKGEFLVTELWLGEAGYGAEGTRSVKFGDSVRLYRGIEQIDVLLPLA